MRRTLVVLVACALTAALVWVAGGVFSARRTEMDARLAAIEAAWAEAEVEIERRADVLPSLVKLVRAYAGPHPVLADQIPQAIEAIRNATTREERIAANDELELALTRALDITARQPGIAEDPGFLRVQDELAGAENRLNIARRKYNQAVQDYNTYIQLFPNTLIVRLSGLERESAYFRTSEEARQGPPPVSFSDPAPAAETPAKR